MTKDETKESQESHRSYGRWWDLGVRAWAIIGCAIVFVLVVRALGMLGQTFTLLLTGIIVGFICSPITNFLEDRGVGRAAGAFVALVVVLAVLAGTLLVLVPPFSEQMIRLLRRVPYYMGQMRTASDELYAVMGSSVDSGVQDTISNLISSIGSLSSSAMGKITQGIIPNIVGTVETFFMFFLGLVLAYWFARDYPKIIREFAKIAGPEHQDDLTLLLAVMSRSMGGYMRGIVITSAVGGLLSFIGFLIIGHPFAGLMGITVGLLHFVPVIGPWCAAGFAMLVALFTSPMLALESLIVSVIAQNVTDNFISPVVMRSAVRVHPVLSLVAIVIGSSLGGIVGMAIAIPLSAAIKGVFIYYFETRTGRQLVSYDGALFRGTPYQTYDGEAVPAYDALDDDHFFDATRLVQVDEAPEASVADRPEGLHRMIPEIVSDAFRESLDSERAPSDHLHQQQTSVSDDEDPQDEN